MHIDRPELVRIGSSELSLPVFFPSVSSVKTAMSPIHYVELLSSLIAINRQFLISAFDIWQASPEDRERFIDLLGKARDSGAAVLMDSGNYESYWKNAMNDWTHSIYHAVLGRVHCSFAFSFDEQFPPLDLQAHAKLVVERWMKDKVAAVEIPIIPIVHGAANDLPEIVLRVAEATDVPMIAVPERRLGSGLFERTKAVGKIRQALNSAGRYVALHLLGTGNPISIAVYVMSGADSFDGLEWCQTVVDHETALLYHLTQADFFRGQTGWGDADLSFQARTLAHNLEFYMDWMRRLRSAVESGRSVHFCRANFPARIFSQCSAEFGWESIP